MGLHIQPADTVVRAEKDSGGECSSGGRGMGDDCAGVVSASGVELFWSVVCCEGLYAVRSVL